MQNNHSGPSRATSGSVAAMLTGIILSVMLGPCTAATTRMRVRRILGTPKSGDLVHQVEDQLGDSHEALGKLSASLIDVQNSVDKTEQSMLGRVLDLQTAKSFFVRHEEIGTSNEKLKDDITYLNNQVDQLSSSLSKTQKAYLQKAAVIKEAEGKLGDEVIENKALISSMTTELAKEDDVQEALKKLKKIHKDLMEEAVDASEAGRKAVASLDKAREECKLEVGKHRDLRAQLVKMNNYSIECHKDVEKASKKLGLAMLADSKDTEAHQMTLRQKKKANEATEQRLLAERAVLVSEIKKHERESVEDVQRLQDLREDLIELQENLVKDIKEAKQKIKEEGERAESLGRDLMANAQAEEEHMAKKDKMDELIKELVKELHESENPVIIAQTEGQNAALSKELVEGYSLFERAKENETTSELGVQMAQAAVKAAKGGLTTAQKAVDDARREGMKKVAVASKYAQKSMEKSTEILDAAKAAVAARCKNPWDEIWKGKRIQLVKCKQIEDELTMEKAKEGSLKATLTAKAESS